MPEDNHDVEDEKSLRKTHSNTQLMQLRCVQLGRSVLEESSGKTNCSEFTQTVGISSTLTDKQDMDQDVNYHFSKTSIVFSVQRT